MSDDVAARTSTYDLDLGIRGGSDHAVHWADVLLPDPSWEARTVKPAGLPPTVDPRGTSFESG